MLLQAIPSQIRDDLVSSRKMTSEQIIYKLMVTFQPGGAGERTKLLQALTNGLFGDTVAEVLEGIRHWRRNVNRALEIGGDISGCTGFDRGSAASFRFSEPEVTTGGIPLEPGTPTAECGPPADNGYSHGTLNISRQRPKR